MTISFRALAIFALLPSAFCQQAAQTTAAQDLTQLSLEQLLNVTVTTASLHSQSLRDAPATITVIPATEIQRLGYRTLAEALSYVSGFFFTNDHTYTYLGARGFSLPGDYDTRIIVMIDGHNIADNIFGQATWFGNDFPVDLDLVDRIEVIRGTSSALYGSSGMLGTINVLTKRPGAGDTEMRMETGSLGERKIEADTVIGLPKGATLLLGASVLNNAGARSLYFPEFDSPETNFGRAVDMDGEKGFHAFADFTWGNWEILAVEGDRVKRQPISWAQSTVFNDRGTSAEDSRGFVEASWSREFERGRSLLWRTSYDSYRYRGIYHYSWDDNGSIIGDYREHDYGDWLSTKLWYRTPGLWGGDLTTGIEFKTDLRALINVFNVAPVLAPILSTDHRDRDAAVFAQHEWTLGRHWELNIGSRFDWSLLKRNALSPRASLIYKPTMRTAIKMLASRGFTNPSTYNMFYSDNGLTQIANPNLRPELVNTFELDIDHQLTSHIEARASVYHYLVSDLIQQVFTSDGVIVYVNQGKVRAAGASFEVSAHLPRGIELQTALDVQRAVFGGNTVLPNSPGQLGKARVVIPLWNELFVLSSGIQAMGQRQTYGGVTLPWVALPEAALTTRRFGGGYKLDLGVKNLSNTFYRVPAGLSDLVDSIIGDGRTYFLSLSWHRPPTDDGASTHKSTRKPLGAL